MGRLRKKSMQKKGDSIVNMFIIFILAVFAGSILAPIIGTSNNHRPNLPPRSKEIQAILSEKDFRKQVAQYTKLIERVGPIEAQEEFQHSGIPFTGQMHLLNHTVGNIIWKKYGPKGITMCKDYFSSSCYHGFILNAIGDGKLDNINLAMKECKKVGWESYLQCAHAVGHGFLAYLGYANMMKALDMCDQVKTNIKDFAANYCYNGVFMENIWGLHEGRPSPDRWVSKDDMRFPCDYKELKERHLPECWYNQALHLNNEFFHGDLVKVAKVCDTVEGDRSKYMCFDGVFRSLHSMTANDIPKKFDKCKQMPNGWEETCIALQAGASFQQGDRELPFIICAETKVGKSKCYQEIANSIQGNIYKVAEKNELCKRIPNEYRMGVCKTIVRSI
ncbi:MAG TPA: hypothetical protein VLG67_02030 [Candidatus Saccharimonadales bacterium]|nr:hypothetical protein [Candidatus Saccharimonadales bacterium]